MTASRLDSKRLADEMVDALDDLKGQAIRSINVQRLTSITDYMVIATGRSNTHIKALSDAVVERCKGAGRQVVGVEGRMHSEWVLVDLGDVVVHIMLAPVRALYKLEDLWSFETESSKAKESQTSPGSG